MLVFYLNCKKDLQCFQKETTNIYDRNVFFGGTLAVSIIGFLFNYIWLVLIENTFINLKWLD